MAKKILIADDTPIFRLMLRDILKFHGYEVVGECVNGQEAVEKYKELKPDLVTLDIMMPEKDGINALKEILKFDYRARVVMITAVDEREPLMNAIRAGAVDYIMKPFEQDRVLSAVKQALGS